MYLYNKFNSLFFTHPKYVCKIKYFIRTIYKKQEDISFINNRLPYHLLSVNDIDAFGQTVYGCRNANALKIINFRRARGGFSLFHTSTRLPFCIISTCNS